MHACDVSQQTRSFETCEKWTYLLFEEFFHQGDLEKDMGYEISRLCDRVKDANVPSSQPGFINFIAMPTWNCMVRLLPEADENLKNI